MKLAIITDQHFGARKGADYIHRYFKKFYDNTFFPYLEKNKIDTVVDMGDTFDNRRNIDLATLEWAKKNYYDRLQAMGITVHTIVGNHTAYYKDTNEINIDGLDILLLPWINEENRTQTMEMIDFYTRYLNEDDIDIEVDGKVNLSDKMGFLTTVDDARLKLEEIFKNNIDKPNNP